MLLHLMYIHQLYNVSSRYGVKNKKKTIDGFESSYTAFELSATTS